VTIGIDRGVKPLLLPPRLRTLDGGDGRRARYRELFFDLVFVVAIAQLAQERVAVLVSGRLEPVAFLAAVAATLVVFVAYKLWSSRQVLPAAT
jgi:low temperature requirement protein LtrA